MTKSYILILFPLTQVYTRLNHVNATISYTATIHTVDIISKQCKIPIDLWVKEGHDFKFVGDNVDKKKGVRDIRVDYQGELKHMFSMLAVRSRVPSHLAPSGPCLGLGISPFLSTSPNFSRNTGDTEEFGCPCKSNSLPIHEATFKPLKSSAFSHPTQVFQRDGYEVRVSCT